MGRRPDRYCWWVVAGLVLIGTMSGSGCSSMSWGRPKVAPDVRTVTSVGDTPQSVVAGMPGASFGSGPILVDRSTGRDGRISGRVVDERGRPLADVEVRVADGAISAGRDLSTRSDDAGGFTLKGLRADTPYTLIASADAGRHSLYGRQRVQAPDSGVAIVLRSGGSSSSSLARRPELSRPWVEDRTDDSDRVVVRTRNTRPALEDEPALDRRLVETAEAEPTTTADFWRSIDQAPTSYGMPLVDGPDESRPERRAGLSVMGLPIEDEDDDRNPLPPARERPTTSAVPPAGSDFEERPPAGRRGAPIRPEPFVSGDGPLVPAFDEPETPTPDQTLPANDSLDERGLATEADEAPSVPPPSATPDGPLSPEELEREFPPSPFVEANAAAPTPPAAPEMEPPAARSDDQPGPEFPALIEGGDIPAAEAPIGLPEPEARPLPDAPRATWSDLTSKSQASGTSIYPLSVRRMPTRGGRAVMARREEPGVRDSAVSQASVRYDNRAKRLVDFTLADLGGQPVQFSDIDADFILLDFWGTWCGPCAKTMPHLVELQKQYDPRRLRVVGIAYERGPRDAQVAAVRRVAGTQRVNYPLLLAEQDGKPCPVMSAFQVDEYPTLILLDREGRILWRDSGSSDAMLQRLDQVIESNTRRMADGGKANPNTWGLRRR